MHFLFQKSKPVLRAGPMLPHLALSHTHSVDARPMSAPIEADSRPRSFTSLSKGGVLLVVLGSECVN